MSAEKLEGAKTINFDGKKYRQLTDNPDYWSDCEFDVLDKETGEWVPVGPNDLIWLYDDKWPADFYREPDVAVEARR
ncbi:hypothetical protein [Rhizobium leucaenae]|uniref:hypothetical protein n=1 Tax=Rhizobium leucaenae TaxID=29450 RepID=UPI0007EE93C5|nr:hypothetical protein [Rhizobium leucaenae]